MVAEHAERTAALEEADATFAVDATMAAAENSEADYEMAAKQAGHMPQDHTAKPGYRGGGAEPEPEQDVVVATLVDAEPVVTDGELLPSEFAQADSALRICTSALHICLCATVDTRRSRLQWTS